MKNYIHTLMRSPLFADIKEDDIESLLNCLNAKIQKVKKDEIILNAGDCPEFVGIVLSGNVHITQDDYWGNRTIIADVGEGEMFAEAFSCAQAPELPVSVIAHRDSVIMKIDCKKIFYTCSSSCVFHSGLIKNIAKILADKNILLTRKMEHITKKTTRDKVLSYLSECAVKTGNDRFEIPFNRQELADYLSVERSALSSTLSKLRDEGLLQFNKNKFTIMH